MLESFSKGNTMKLTVAVAVAAVALAASACSAQAHPGMHATPAGHSRPDAAPDSHEECVLKAARVSASEVGQSALPILAILNVPDLPLMGIASRLTHSFELFRDPFVLFFPTHERSPPVSFLS
jgi:hypothetical protein